MIWTMRLCRCFPGRALNGWRLKWRTYSFRLDNGPILLYPSQAQPGWRWSKKLDVAVYLPPPYRLLGPGASWESEIYQSKHAHLMFLKQVTHLMNGKSASHCTQNTEDAVRLQCFNVLGAVEVANPEVQYNLIHMAEMCHDQWGFTPSWMISVWRFRKRSAKAVS